VASTPFGFDIAGTWLVACSLMLVVLHVLLGLCCWGCASGVSNDIGIYGKKLVDSSHWNECCNTVDDFFAS
jgi:hypothetical protein